MPQLVKGGKYVFGISEVRPGYRIQVPPEALREYELDKSDKIVILPGSKTSGGFGVNSPLRLSRSALSPLLHLAGYDAGSQQFGIPEYAVLTVKNRAISWTCIDQKGEFCLSERLAQLFGIHIPERLVVVRGGSIGPGFIACGPIYEEAMCHEELSIY